jgi:hypothetical protein
MIDELILFSDKDFWKLINDLHATKGGAYKIIAVKNGKRIPVHRFLGTDAIVPGVPRAKVERFGTPGSFISKAGTFDYQ